MLVARTRRRFPHSHQRVATKPQRASVSSSTDGRLHARGRPAELSAKHGRKMAAAASAIFVPPRPPLRRAFDGQLMWRPAMIARRHAWLAPLGPSRDAALSVTQCDQRGAPGQLRARIRKKKSEKEQRKTKDDERQVVVVVYGFYARVVPSSQMSNKVRAFGRPLEERGWRGWFFGVVTKSCLSKPVVSGCPVVRGSRCTCCVRASYIQLTPMRPSKKLRVWFRKDGLRVDAAGRSSKSQWASRANF